MKRFSNIVKTCSQFINGAVGQSRSVASYWWSLIIGTLLLSSSVILIRFIDLPAISIAFWSQVIIMVGLIVWQHQHLRQIPAILLQDRASCSRILILGVVTAVDRLAFTTAILIAPVAKVLVVVYLFPIYTMFLAHWILDERMTPRMFIAAVTAFLGVIILTWPDLSLRQSGNLLGLLLAGIVSVDVAIGRIMLKGIDQRISTTHIMLIESILASMILAPIALSSAPIPSSFGAISLLFVYGLLYGVIIHLIILTGLRVVAAGPAATIGYLEPVVASVLAWWILSEPITLYTFVGGALVLAGSLTVVLAQLNANNFMLPRLGPLKERYFD